MGKKRLAREDDASREAVAEAGVKTWTRAPSDLALRVWHGEGAAKGCEDVPAVRREGGDDHWFVG